MKIHPLFKNILAVVAGIVLGSVINMSLIMMSSSVIPPPDGANVTTVEGLKASMHLFQPKHFIFPFLAHALGTFLGAFITALIAGKYKIWLALLIGVVFLIGGVINVLSLPSPLWFSTLDLVVAYLPMGYFAGWIVVKKGYFSKE